MPYLDFTTEDETTIKDKIDESLDLFREPPASTTSSGGTAGIDYDVADWPDTLVSGRTYYARVHVTNIGSYNIDTGGGAITVLRPGNGGTSTRALDALQGQVYGFYFTGSNLIQSTIPKSPSYELASITSGSNQWARICRIRMTARFNDAVIRLHVDPKVTGISSGIATVDIQMRQSDALGNDPDISITVKDADGVRLGYDSFVANRFVVDGTESTYRFFMRDTGISTAEATFMPEVLLQDGATEITFYNNQAAESAGTQEVTSQAARGEVVSEESFSIGGDFSDTGYARKVRGDGGDWVTVSFPDMSHASLSNVASASGDLPAKYRPSEQKFNVYYFAASALKRVDIDGGGTISITTVDWTGSSFTATKTWSGSIGPYFVPD